MIDKNKITISVIIPCFNHGHFLEDAIQSLSNQSFEGVIETLIVNDGSTDSYTLDKLDELSKRGYVVIQQTNQGLGSARNNGIKIAKGDYILLLDSDNKIAKNFIELGIKILSNLPEIGVVYGDVEYFGDKNGFEKIPEFDLLKILCGNYIDACSIVRKEVFFELGFYDTNREIMAYTDWDFWIRVGKSKWKFHHLNELTFYYRVSQNSMISEFQKEKGMQINAFRYIVNKHFDSYFYILEEFGNIRNKLKILEHKIHFKSSSNLFFRLKNIISLLIK